MAVPPATNKPPLSSVRAWSCLGINLFATPGLGSYMAGRKVAGQGQLLLSIIGFFLIVTWIIKLSIHLTAAEIDGTDSTPIPAWWWQVGGLCFGIGWLWSLVTSISLLIQAKNEAVKAPPKLAASSRPVPPKL